MMNRIPVCHFSPLLSPFPLERMPSVESKIKNQELLIPPSFCKYVWSYAGTILGWLKLSTPWCVCMGCVAEPYFYFFSISLSWCAIKILLFVLRFATLCSSGKAPPSGQLWCVLSSWGEDKTARARKDPALFKSKHKPVFPPRLSVDLLVPVTVPVLCWKQYGSVWPLE